MAPQAQTAPNVTNIKLRAPLVVDGKEISACTPLDDGIPVIKTKDGFTVGGVAVAMSDVSEWSIDAPTSKYD